MNCDESGFTIQLDVKHFKPGDLLVKVIGDFVEVQGKHEEKTVGGLGFCVMDKLFTKTIKCTLNFFSLVLILEGWIWIDNKAV